MKPIVDRRTQLECLFPQSIYIFNIIMSEYITDYDIIGEQKNLTKFAQMTISNKFLKRSSSCLLKNVKDH